MQFCQGIHVMPSQLLEDPFASLNVQKATRSSMYTVTQSAESHTSCVFQLVDILALPHKRATENDTLYLSRI